MQVQRTCLVVLRDLRRRVRVLLIISVFVIAFTLWTLRLERWPEVDDSDSERDNFSFRLLSSNATRLSEICTVIAADANPLVANNHRRPTEEDASNMNVPDPLSPGNFIATGHPSRSFRGMSFTLAPVCLPCTAECHQKIYEMTRNILHLGQVQDGVRCFLPRTNGAADKEFQRTMS